MANSGAGAPLSRREPGAARQGPGGQSNKRVLSDSTLTRIKAAIDAENAQAEDVRQDGPNTEPIPRVTDSGSPGKRGATRAPSPSGDEPEPGTLPHRNPGKPGGGASQPLSPSGVAPEPEAQTDQTAKPDRRARPPRPDEPLRVAKALRIVEPDWPQAVEPPPPPAELPPPVPPTPRVQAAPAAEAAPPVELVPPAEMEPPTEVQLPAEFEPPTPLRLAPPAAVESAPPPPPPPAIERAAQWPPKGTEPTPGSIGWLWPDEATSGGGGGRWRPPGPWRYRVVGLVAAGALVLGGAGVIIGMTLHSHSTPATTGPATSGTNGSTGPASSSSGPNSNSATVPLPSTSTAAASWITNQVAAGTAVACDAQMCSALTTAGFPAAQEVQVATTSQSLSNAKLVVLTPQLRRYFRAVNPRLGRHVAPPALASFGGISVHPIDQNGAVAYESQLSQDLRARVETGDQLIHSGRVTATPSAATELAAGQVDSRILLALQALSAHEPVHVLAFSDSGPGASSGIPYRVVELAAIDPAAGMNASQYLGTLHRMLLAHANFPAWTHIHLQPMPDGTRAVQIEYAAPSPLGALTP